MTKGSQTAGVKPMSIAGRFERERERLMGMTDEERAFRKQWLKDQELAHNEPKHVPEMYKATNNPIRRAYKWPLNQLAKAVEPILGKEKTITFRWVSGKLVLLVGAAYIGTYYFKYCANDWTRTGGWKVLSSKKAVLPGDPGFPQVSDRNLGEDYASRGFKDVKLNL